MESEAETLLRDEHGHLTQQYEISSQKKQAIKNCQQNDAE